MSAREQEGLARRDAAGTTVGGVRAVDGGEGCARPATADTSTNPHSSSKYDLKISDLP